MGFVKTMFAVGLGVWVGLILNDTLRLGDKIRAALPTT